MRHQHADTLDDDVVDLEGAFVGNEPPIDLDGRLATRTDEVCRDDDPVSLRSTALDLECLAVEVGKAGAIDKDYVVLEQL